MISEGLKQWLLNNAHRELCPPCAGRKVAVNLAPHIVQCNCICPNCNKVWIYKTQSERAIKNRRPIWHYSKEQFD